MTKSAQGMIAPGAETCIKLGVVGLGLAWKKIHEPILRQLSDKIKISALCDVSQNALAESTACFPHAECFDDYAKLCASNVDAVLVVTPIPLNANVALAALNQGHHVVIEKPLTLTASEGRNLIQVARSRERHLLVAEQLAYAPTISFVRQKIQDGSLGKVLGWQATVHLTPDDGFTHTPWRRNPSFPLGRMFDTGIHAIAWLGQAFGHPDWVYAMGQYVGGVFGAYDRVVALFRYGDGTVGTLSFATCLHPEPPVVHVYGQDGTMLLDHASGMTTLTSRAKAETRSIDESQQNSYVLMWQSLTAVLCGNSAVAYSAEEAVADVETLELINASMSYDKPLQRNPKI